MRAGRSQTCNVTKPMSSSNAIAANGCATGAKLDKPTCLRRCETWDARLRGEQTYSPYNPHLRHPVTSCCGGVRERSSRATGSNLLQPDWNSKGSSEACMA